MQVVEKHGGVSHFMRPDRVYRTGVLSPSATFSPGQDVQAIASEFTERSMNLSGLGSARPMNAYQRQQALCCYSGDVCCDDRSKTRASNYAFAGLFGPTAKTSFFERMRLRFESWRAKMFPSKAQASAVHAAQQAARYAAEDAQPYEKRAQAVFANPASRGMAYAQVGSQVAPYMMGQVRMLAQLTAGSMPAHVADAQVATSMERWNNLRWNG